MVSILATIICFWGIGIVFHDQFYTSSAKQLVTPSSDQNINGNSNGYTLLALGDSLTRGTGDSKGKGYIGYLMDHLKATTKTPIHLTNLAINGQTSSELLKQMQQPEVKQLIEAANVIVFTIGGNDLFNGGQNLTDFSAEQVQKEEQSYLANLKTIYKEMRRTNNKATIFHVGLYNPFGAIKQAGFTSTVVRKWNFDSAELASTFPNIVYVPTFDLFQLHVNDYLYNDKFHPNSEGYQLIGERLASLVHLNQDGGVKSEK